MKTHKRLWDKFISRENFELAAKKAVKSKKSKRSVKNFLRNKDENIEKLRRALIDGTYRTSKYETFIIYEPKQRIIYKLPLYPDHVLHHALINVLGPIWQGEFIHDSYACIPGRGLLSASQRTMQFVRRNKYVLQCDIRKFFPSINHEIMKDIVRRKVNDRRLMRVLSEVIDSVGGNTNLPIGNLTSQWMGNVYLNELDMFVKHVLHWRDYIRYCDDFCLYGDDKQKLRDAKSKIVKFLRENLNMELSKSAVKRTSDGIGFIGYRHFKNFVLIRKKPGHRLKTRIIYIAKRGVFDDRAVAQMAAMFGWTKWANSCRFKISLVRIAQKYGAGWFVKKYLFRL
jgi:retron-type reverse transcriptase